MLFSEKLDGVYAFLVATNEGNAFYSRTGEYYSSMQGLADELILLKDRVYITELYTPGYEQSDISGIARRDEPTTELWAWVHDALTIDEFLHGCSPRPYSERVNGLLVAVGFENHDRFGFVDQQEMSFAEALVAAHDIQMRGGEGGIIRPLDALWQAGNRSRNLIRVKEKITRDYECTGFYPGKGKRAALIGGLIFTTADGKEVRAGGGKWFTEANMQAFVDEPSKFLNGIFQLSAMKVNKYGNLREPRVDCQRFDKTEID